MRPITTIPTDYPGQFLDPQIEMAHGAGGKASRKLIEGLFLPLLNNPLLEPLDDAARLDVDGTELALTIDSFVVRPLSFPGGSIGTLAVNGTVNDLVVSGSRPLALAAGFVLEAGLPAEVLRTQVEALSEAAREAGVAVVCGDTKVVEKGKADGMYITTAGIGRRYAAFQLAAQAVSPGDRILLSGPIGDHGITILLARGDLDFDADLVSDSRPLTSLVEALIVPAAAGVRWMRDPTRGGVASALNELAQDCGLSVVLEEDRLPMRQAVRGACEILGLDPLHIANEGQFLAVVAPEWAESALESLRRTPGGEQSELIGEIQAEPKATVLCKTSYGGRRIVEMLVGDPLPRIC